MRERISGAAKLFTQFEILAASFHFALGKRFGFRRTIQRFCERVRFHGCRRIHAFRHRRLPSPCRAAAHQQEPEQQRNR